MACDALGRMGSAIYAAPDEVDHGSGDLGALRLLQEVTSAAHGEMVDAPCTRQPGLERFGISGASDEVVVAERSAKGPVERFKNLPGLTALPQQLYDAAR